MGTEEMEDTQVVSEEVVESTEATPEVEPKVEATNEEGAETAAEEAGEETPKPAAEAAPKYEPNFKYKVYGEEKEFDKKLQSLIKDKEVEEHIRSLYAKADGIEGIQGQRDHYRKSYQELNNEVQQVLTSAQKGDIQGVLKSVGVDTSDISKVISGLGFRKEDIIRHAYELAQMSPEQEQAMQRQREMEAQAFEQQSYAQQTQTELQQVQAQLKSIQLDKALSTPEMSPIVEAFDSAYGKGAFWNEVCTRGEYYHSKGNPNVPVEQLVEEIAKFARVGMQNQNNSQAETQSTPTLSPQRPKEKIPVIPNVNAGTASPARKKAKRLSDLRNMAKELSD